MRAKVIVDDRVTVTIVLPQAFGLRPSDELIVEQTEQGLLLRPAVIAATEIYSEERIAEFASDKEAIG